MFLFQRKNTSSSSVPKSTSSMTLPLSTPSSHSHFDDMCHQAQIPSQQVDTLMPPATPTDVEKRLDLLGR